MVKLYKQFFIEVKKPTMSYVPRNSKIDREVGRLSNQVSRDNEDGIYKRMVYHRNKYKEFKAKILAKYKSRVKTQARK